MIYLNLLTYYLFELNCRVTHGHKATTKSMPLDTTSIIGEDGDKTRCPRCSGKVITHLFTFITYLFTFITYLFTFHRSLLQKKWWQPLAITTDIVSDVAFVVNHWILHLFVMVLMTRFTAGCVMDVLGIFIFLLYAFNRDRLSRFEDSGRSKIFYLPMSFDSLWDVKNM